MKGQVMTPQNPKHLEAALAQLDALKRAAPEAYRPMFEMLENEIIALAAQKVRSDEGE